MEITDPNEKSLWEKMTPYAMSDQETDEEHGGKTFRTIIWRTDEANDLIQRLDTALGVRRLYSGRSDREVDLKKVSPDIVSSQFLS